MFIVKNLLVLKTKIQSLKVIFCGTGLMLDHVRIVAKKLNVDDIIWFAGYRKDINTLCNISDLYITTSRQEGLPISVIEAFSSGLPVIASNIRGQVDVVVPERNGELYRLNDNNDFIAKILKVYNNPELHFKISSNNIDDAKKYSVENLVRKMAEIYNEWAAV